MKSLANLTLIKFDALFIAAKARSYNWTLVPNPTDPRSRALRGNAYLCVIT